MLHPLSAARRSAAARASTSSAFAAANSHARRPQARRPAAQCWRPPRASASSCSRCSTSTSFSSLAQHRMAPRSVARHRAALCGIAYLLRLTSHLSFPGRQHQQPTSLPRRLLPARNCRKLVRCAASPPSFCSGAPLAADCSCQSRRSRRAAGLTRVKCLMPVQELVKPRRRIFGGHLHREQTG